MGGQIQVADLENYGVGLGCTFAASILTYYCTCKYADLLRLFFEFRTKKKSKSRDAEIQVADGDDVDAEEEIPGGLGIYSLTMKPISYLLFLCFLCALLSLDFVALMFLPLCTVIVVSMMVFVWGFLYGVVVHHNWSFIKRHRIDAFIATTIMTVVALAIVYAPGSYDSTPVSDIVKFDTTSIIYTVIFIGVAILLHLLRFEVISSWFPGTNRDKKTLIYASLTGILGGQAFVVLSLFADIIHVAVRNGTLIFSDGVTIVVTVATAVCMVLHALHMHWLLREASDLNTHIVIPAHRAMLLISALAGAAAYLREFENASQLSRILYSVFASILILICGALVYQNLEPQSETEVDLDETETQSLWNLGNMTGIDDDLMMFHNARDREDSIVDDIEAVPPLPPMNYTYPVVKHSLMVFKGLPNPHTTPGNSYWEDAGEVPEAFKVRDVGYATERKKTFARPSCMRVATMQWTTSQTPVKSFGQLARGYVQTHHANRLDRPFMLVINFMVPSLGNYVTYHILKKSGSEDPVFCKLLNDFVNASEDTFRNERFKLIPGVLEGNYFVKKAVGSKPALIGTKLTTKYYKSWNTALDGPVEVESSRGEWFEIAVDISSSAIAKSVMGSIKGFASGLALRLGYLIEGKTDEELPERMIGGIDLYRPAMKSTIASSGDPVYDEVPTEEAVYEMEQRDALSEMGDDSDIDEDDYHSVMESDTEEDGMRSAQCSGAHVARGSAMNTNDQYPVPERTLVVPQGVENPYAPKGKSFWVDSGRVPGGWQLRGPSYDEDGVKAACGLARMKIVAMQLHYTPEKSVDHMSALEGGFMKKHHIGDASRPFLFVFNFLVPSVGNFVVYLARDKTVEDPIFNEMMCQFIEHEDDRYRDHRLKLIPGVVNGSYFVKKVVGSKPALVATKLTTQYFRGDNYFEVSIDVGSSIVGSRIFSAVKGFASGLSLHLGVCLESRTKRELPERLLFGIDIHSPVMKPS